MKNLYSMTSTGKFGVTGHLGESMFGQNCFGVQNVYICHHELGKCVIGDNEIGEHYDVCGIYRRNRGADGQYYEKIPWYVTKNPRTENQQTNRSRFADAIAAWHELTEQEKMLYNQKSKQKRKTGFNIFIAEYMRG